ncbi:unnamed protein product [Symbiodinium sp. KB8]|nr:unnamed protein product [Symbiodinium sp. KB8]
MGMRRKNLRLKRRVVCCLREPRKAPSPFRKIHLMLKRCPQATHSSLHYRRTPRSYREDQDQKSCPANLRRASCCNGCSCIVGQTLKCEGPATRGEVAGGPALGRAGLAFCFGVLCQVAPSMARP